jgi:hypothetical protein
MTPPRDARAVVSTRVVVCERERETANVLDASLLEYF